MGCLEHFITLIKPAKSNEMENNLTEVTVGWISECGILPLLRVEETYVLIASAISTGNSALRVLKMMKLTNWVVN